MKAIEGQTWKLFEQEFLPLGKTYDYVIFDCPPGISPLSETAVRASDLIIVPTIPDFVSVFGLKAFVNIFWKAPSGSLPRPKRLPHVLVTKFQKAVKQHKDYVERLEAAAKIKVPDAIDIDGLAVLHAIAENPLAFPDVVAELNKVARALVVKQFKAKATTLESLRHIHSAIGGEAFVLILDDLGDSGSDSLVKRLDKDNSELKTAQPAWPRKRLADLASGAAVPAKKPPKPVPAKKASKLATAKNAPKPAQSPEQKALAAGSRPKRQIWPRRATFGAARRRKLHACSRRPGLRVLPRNST
jgi:AAA domain